MIEHRGVGGDKRGVEERQVGRARGQFDLFCFFDQRCQKDHATGDRFGQIGHMFADECLTIAKLVGQDHCILILFENLPVVPRDRVNRLGKKTNFHDCILERVLFDDPD